MILVGIFLKKTFFSKEESVYEYIKRFFLNYVKILLMGSVTVYFIIYYIVIYIVILGNSWTLA